MDNKKKTACGVNYDQYIYRKILTIVILVILTFLTALFAITAGSADIPVTEVLKALFGLGAAKNVLVTVNIRLPRILPEVRACFQTGAEGIAVGIKIGKLHLHSSRNQIAASRRASRIVLCICYSINRSMAARSA